MPYDICPRIKKECTFCVCLISIQVFLKLTPLQYLLWKILLIFQLSFLKNPPKTTQHSAGVKELGCPANSARKAVWLHQKPMNVLKCKVSLNPFGECWCKGNDGGSLVQDNSRSTEFAHASRIRTRCILVLSKRAQGCIARLPDPPSMGEFQKFIDYHGSCHADSVFILLKSIVSFVPAPLNLKNFQ